MKCVTCGQHFFKSQYDNGKQCFDCQDVILEDDDVNLEVNTLLNPSGKVRACIQDDNDEGFGF